MWSPESLTATTVVGLVLVLQWTYISSATKNWKHPFHEVISPTMEVLEGVLNSNPFSFAPGLFEVLKSTTPPTLAFFQSLPFNMDNQ
jgi:hypothetical protein